MDGKLNNIDAERRNGFLPRISAFTHEEVIDILEEINKCKNLNF